MALTRRGRLVVSVIGAIALVAVGGIALALTGHAPAVIQEAVDKVTGKVARAGAASHMSADGQARAARRGPAPAGAGRQGREHARRVPARGPPERRRGVRGARRGRHHALHGAVPVQGRQAGRARPERAHDGSEGVDPVRPAFGDRVLGWSARRGQRRRALGAHQLRRGLGRRRVLARRRSLRAAQPVREHRQAAREVGEELTAGEGPPRRLFPFDETAPTVGKHVSQVSVEFSYSVDATWKWDKGAGKWQRMLDGAPMTLDTGTPITAANVIIQQVVVTEGDLVDVLGIPLAGGHGDGHRQGMDPAGRRDDRRAPGAGR